MSTRRTRSKPLTSKTKPQLGPQPLSHPEPRTPQEHLLYENALRRERAVLWTDDRPFSVWKS